MAWIYLCLNPNDIVSGIAVLEYQMIHPERIEWPTADYTLIGKKYNREDGTISDAPPFVEVRDITRLQFRHKFTLSEMLSIYAATSTDPVIKIFLDDLAAAEYIDLNDPLTQQSVGYLYQAGYITYERMLEVLE